MNFKQKLTYICFLILFTGSMVIMVNPAMGRERSDEAIALWVADQIKLTEPFDMPTRHFVDKATLELAFEVGNKPSYHRWQEEYGEEKANEILEDYLDQIVGLFNEKNQVIYVGNFIDACSQEAVFAHEMVHYFQYMTEGVIPPDSYEEEMQRLLREMHAYHIEEKYHLTFCEGGQGAAPNPDDIAIDS